MSSQALPEFSFLSPSDHLLILGGTGLFGQHLLPKLSDYVRSHPSPPTITLTTRDPDNLYNTHPYLVNSPIIVCQVDFLREAKLFLRNTPSHVLHMANMSASDTYHGALDFNKYRLLVNSVEALRGVVVQGITKRILFTSSGVAYGQVKQYKETHPSILNPLDQRSSLAFGKLNAEYLLSQLCRDIKAHLTIARCFSFVSPFLPTNLHYALGNFVSDAVSRQPITINGDGTDLRSYQHVDDTIAWILSILQMQRPPVLINVGSDIPISIYQLAELVRRLLSPGLSIEIMKKPTHIHNTPRSSYVPDLSLAYSLGLKNTLTLESSILQLAASIGANQYTA